MTSRILTILFLLTSFTLVACDGDDGAEATNAAEGEEAPAEGEEAPAEGEEAPAEGEEAPAEGEEAPVEGEETTDEGGDSDASPYAGYWKENGETDDYVTYLHIADDNSGYHCVQDEKSSEHIDDFVAYLEENEATATVSDDGETLTTVMMDDGEEWTTTFAKVDEADYPACCQEEEDASPDADYVCSITYNE